MVLFLWDSMKTLRQKGPFVWHHNVKHTLLINCSEIGSTKMSYPVYKLNPGSALYAHIVFIWCFFHQNPFMLLGGIIIEYCIWG